MVSYERGRLMPLHRGAASKVILAGLPSRIVKGFFEQDPGRFAAAGLGDDWEGVKQSLRVIRRGGGTVTYGELDPGLVGLASPIIAADDTVLGSLGFASTAEHMDGPTIARLKDLVIAATARINAAQRRSQ
nr:IclR family transcriptional regulator C-terminal domain-containing protein [Fertoeibacter niger]